VSGASGSTFVLSGVAVPPSATLTVSVDAGSVGTNVVLNGFGIGASGVMAVTCTAAAGSVATTITGAALLVSGGGARVSVSNALWSVGNTTFADATGAVVLSGVTVTGATVFGGAGALTLSGGARVTDPVATSFTALSGNVTGPAAGDTLVLTSSGAATPIVFNAIQFVSDTTHAHTHAHTYTRTRAYERALAHT
jgi:hypothetical protein